MSDDHSIKQQIDRFLDEAQKVRNDDPVAARKALSKVASLLESCNYPYGQMHYLALDGIVAFFQGEYGQALKSLNEALTEDIDATLRKRVLNMLAATYRQIGDFSRASETYHQLLDLQETDQKSVIQALNGLSGVYSYMDDNQSAAKYVERALKIARETGDQFAEGMLLGNGVRIYSALEQPKKAIDYGEKSIKILEKLGKKARSVHALMFTATAYQNLKQYDRAIDYLERAIAISQEYQMQDNWFQAMYFLADVYHTAQKTDKALRLLHTIIDTADADYKLSRFESSQRLYLIYKEKGDYQQALIYLELYHQLHEQIHSEQAAERIQNLEIQFRTREALQETAFYRERASEMEALREQDRRYFEQLSRIKDDFISTTSHDLKNPLARVTLNLYLLEQGNDLKDDRSKKLLARSRAALQLMKDMLTDTLDIVRLETGRSLEKQQTSITSLLRGVIESFEISAEQGQITLHLSVPDNLMVYCDPVLIRSALHNLLSNAVKYTPPGGDIYLRACLENSDLHLIVQDTGYGITEEYLPYIFDRFYRSPDQPDEKIEGTGLGLSIVKLVVENHGGTVQARSQVGSGSTFTIILPQNHIENS